jgi:hypothetical protein
LFSATASGLNLPVKPSLPVFRWYYCSPQVLVSLLFSHKKAVTSNLKRTSVCPEDVYASFTFSLGQLEKQKLAVKSGMKCLSLSILLPLLFIPRQNKKPHAS